MRQSKKEDIGRPQWGGGKDWAKSSSSRAEPGMSRALKEGWRSWSSRSNGANGAQRVQKGTQPGSDHKRLWACKKGLKRHPSFSQTVMSVFSKRVNYLITCLKITLVMVEDRSGSRKVRQVTLATLHEGGWWYLGGGKWRGKSFSNSSHLNTISQAHPPAHVKHWDPKLGADVSPQMQNTLLCIPSGLSGKGKK